MELICEKYQTKMDSESASCLHPDEYCKFRTSCIIHFIGKEAVFESRRKEAPAKEKKLK